MHQQTLSDLSIRGSTLAFALGAALVALPATAQGDEPPTRAAIQARYDKELDRLEQDRIKSLIDLAATQPPHEADVTNLEVFRLAIGTDQFRAAEPASDRVLATHATVETELTAMARLVKIIAEADRGELEGSMRDLRAALATRTGRDAPHVEARTSLATAEAYFRRLLRSGRFDLAREVCDLAIQTTGNAAVRDHFIAYRHRLDLVGKPAPELSGNDADGKPLKLSDTRGKVVLVVFWATWCPPCVEGIPYLKQVYQKLEKDGLAIFSVNLDTGPDRQQAVRRFLVEHGTPWPTLLATEPSDPMGAAATYGVKEIPATVLIDRDGRVSTFDLSRDDMLDAVRKALAQPDATK